VIQSFRCKKTQALYEGLKCDKQWLAFRSVAERKLGMLDAAVLLKDLSVPPANGLEALKRDRKGQHSIRINDQFRICFAWTANGPTQVEIVDYH
jgi:proteic killer suppression protein